MNKILPSNHMSISIKKTKPADINSIKKLEAICLLSEWSKNDYFLEITRKDSIFLTALENSEQVGFILARVISSNEFSYEQGIVEIYNIGVAKNSRRKGIGLKLINELIRITRKKAVGSIHLEVRKSNRGAFDFYQAIGFFISGERKNFYANPSDDALLMKLELSTVKILQLEKKGNSGITFDNTGQQWIFETGRKNNFK